MIDHSLLHPTMTDAIVTEGCEVAKSHGVATACVKPYSTAMAARILEGSGVAVCTVTGFPHGNSTVAIKVEETKLAMREGATEIDTVVNIGKVLGGDWEYVTAELREVNAAATGGGAILKVIFENDYLQDEHIVKLCGICSKLQVAFVKTSTGYGFVRQSNGMYAYQGATDHHLQLMRANCPPSVQVKAAGGVRALDDVLRVRALGVTRIGATATVAILEEARKRGIT
ncbi:MAG: deoxyribose-phosphate aldolase [Candidatus Coatesbacteria bacterium]